MTQNSSAALKKQLIEQTLRALSLDSRVQRSLQVGSSIGGTAFVALGSAAVSYSPDTRIEGVVAVVLGLCLSAAGVLLALGFTRITPELLATSFGIVRERDVQAHRCSKLEARNAILLATLERLALLSSIAQLQRGLIEEAITKPPRSREERDAIIGDMLDLLLREKKALFGIANDGYSFAVYVASLGARELIPVVVRRPTRSHERGAMNAGVSVEFGITGHAFRKNREYVCFDTASDGVFEVRIDRSDDGERYRSIAAVPITLAGAVRPMGVVVASSDVVGRFGGAPYDSIEPLRVLASHLALYFGVVHKPMAEGVHARD
jgi:hypothetical protein